MKHARRRFLLVAGGAAAGVASRLAWAQAYPAHAVHAIVPFAPGGATDIIARLVLQDLSRQLGQTFYVENIPGASGNIGTGQAAKAAPDGYTILLAYSSHATNPLLFDKVPYDPIGDFAPVTLMVTSPGVVSVHPSFPAGTIEELVALIEANPGKYSFASGGTGTPPHLAAEQLRFSLGLDFVHVPYNGGGPAIAAAVGGHVPIVFSTLSSTVSQIRQGALRALAVTARTRSQSVPGVPTMAEAGYPDIEGDTWVGVLVPARTSTPIVALLNREIVRILGTPATKERLVQLGYEAVGTTPDEFGARIRKEMVRWAEVVRSAGIRME